MGMTNGILVNPAEMEDLGKNTLKLSEDLKGQIDELTNNKDNLMSIWMGDAASAFDASVVAQLTNLDKFKALIEEMGNRIVKGSGTFNDNEEENTNTAKRLFNDIDQGGM